VNIKWCKADYSSLSNPRPSIRPPSASSSNRRRSIGESPSEQDADAPSIIPPLSIYLFYFRFGRKFNKATLESLNENSLIVNNVIDARSEHSASTTVPFELSSRIISFCKTFIPVLFDRRSSPIRTASGQREQPNANITNDVSRFRNSSNLFTRV